MNISGAAAAASAGDDGSICKSDADLLNIYGRLGGGGRCSTSAQEKLPGTQTFSRAGSTLPPAAPPLGATTPLPMATEVR